MARRFKRASKRAKAIKRAKSCTEIRKRRHRSAVHKAKTFVLNLSQKQLTDQQVLVLSKGLKFVPTPCNKNALKMVMESFNEFARKLRCKHYFSESKNSEIHPFRLKSGFSPEPTSPVLEQYIELTKLEISSIELSRSCNNISHEERKSLKDMKNLSDIIITKADKSNTIVILDKPSYIKEAERQLNSQHYMSVEKVNLDDVKGMITSKIEEMTIKGTLDKESIYYLKQQQATRLGRFYLLPKIHKLDDQTIERVKAGSLNENPIMPAGRPIIAQINVPTAYIAHYCDYFLVPLVTKQSTYLKDTKDFIVKLESLQVPENSFLAVYDATSMYTNLTFEELLDAVEKAYDPTIIQRWVDITCPDKEDMIDLLRIILENNFFEFNGKTYKQCIGTSIGSSVSPQISDIRMYELTNTIIENFKYKTNIIYHKRFRDDGFIIYNSDCIDEIHELFKIANSMHPLLKFTYSISKTEITFLDTTVYKGERFMESRILDIKSYIKPTNNFQYLHRSSSHPKSVFTGLVKGECIKTYA